MNGHGSTITELMVSDPLAARILSAAGLVFAHLSPAGETVYDPTALGYALMAVLMVFTLASAHYVHRYRPARKRAE